MTFLLFLFRALNRAWQIISCVSFLNFFDYVVNHRVRKTILKDFRVSIVITRELIEINRQTGHDRASYNISEKLTEKNKKKSTTWSNRIG